VGGGSAFIGNSASGILPRMTIGDYLIQRLAAHGVGHVFGIPGDYVLGFYDQLLKSELKIVTTCDEQGAGFAADAYARVRGMGAVCITYCVGGLKVVNPIAGAYAEKSPVVVISGAPGMNERDKNPLLHHKVREFDTQKRVFDEITVASAVLDDPDTALAEIDRVLHAAVRFKRPVYIEIPRDLAAAPGLPHHRTREVHEASEPPALEEAVAEAVAMLNAARQPVILADVEVHRFGLQAEALALIERANVPFAATILGKSVLSEQHPLYLGIYEGAMGREEVRAYVESSDCVLLLGAFMTDINLGIYTARLDLGKSIYTTSEKLGIRHHQFEGVRFKDFIRALTAAGLRRHEPGVIPKPPQPHEFVPGRAGEKVTIARLFERLNEFVAEKMAVVADVGNALFGASDLFIRQQTEFLGPAYYASMGFAVPAALGVQMARPDLRPLVLVGDGAFQMTGMELSTIARCGLNPVIVVLNNAGYGTERLIHDGPFNDILGWRFHRLPEVLGVGRAFLVETESQLDEALDAAAKHTASYVLLDVHLDPLDKSAALGRLAERLAERLTKRG
jgi:indolepyruvate decarboxylase